MTPLATKSQEKAREEKLGSVVEGRLKTYDPGTDNAKAFVELLRKRMTRQIAASLVACVHCGRCAESCHYYLARPGRSDHDPGLEGRSGAARVQAPCGLDRAGHPVVG